MSPSEALLVEPALGTLAVEVPPALSQRLQDWTHALLPPGIVTHWEEADHVTVKYGLTTTSAPVVEAACRDARPFPLTLGPSAVFAQPGQDVFVLRVIAPALVALHNQLESRLAWSDTNQPYLPHLTLAILAPGTGAPYVGLQQFAGESWPATTLVFTPKAAIADPSTIPLTRPPQGGALEFTEQELADPRAVLDQPLFVPRPLSPLERTVPFEEIDAAQKTTAKALLALVQPLVETQIEALADTLARADVTGLGAIRAPGVGKIAAAIRPFLARAYRYGRTCVNQETRDQCARKGLRGFALAEPTTDKEVFDFITARSGFLSERWANRLKEIAAEERLRGERLGQDQKTIRARILTALKAALAGWFAAQVIQAVIESYGLGRRIEALGLAQQIQAHPQPQTITPIPPEVAAVFRPVPSEIPQGGAARRDAGIPSALPHEPPPFRMDSGLRSAILDRNLCPHCRALDGLVAPLADPRMHVPDPACHGTTRGGNLCRCIVINIVS